MRRFHSKESRRIRKRRRVIALRFEIPAQINFNNRHPLDCGRSKCACCHGSKIMGVKTLKMIIADIDFEEQV